MSKAIATALVVIVGLAAANPVFAGERKSKSDQNHCPDMPTTNDVDRARDGGASLQIAGFGVSGNKSRAHSVKDVMMREGGIEAWSAALLLVKACHDLQQQYPHDVQRQRRELLNLRGRLLSPVTAHPSDPAPTTYVDVSAPAGQPVSRGLAKAFDPHNRKPAADTSIQGAAEPPGNTSDAPKQTYATPTITTMCAGNGCMQTHQNMTTTTCTVSQPTVLQLPPLQIGNMTISRMPITIGGNSTSCMTTFGF